MGLAPLLVLVGEDGGAGGLSPISSAFISGQSWSMVPPAATMARRASRRPLRLLVCLRMLTSATRQKSRRPSRCGPRCGCCPCPGRRSAGLAFGHAVHHVAPDLLWPEFAGLDAGDGLDVGGEAFFHPVLVVGQGWEGQWTSSCVIVQSSARSCSDVVC
jgi:hypothetical protein